MKYKRATDLLLSSGVLDFSTAPNLNAATVLGALLADKSFTGVIKLSDDFLKQRAGILFYKGGCIGGFHIGKDVSINAFGAETIKTCSKMSQVERNTYEAYTVPEPQLLALSSIFRGYPDEQYQGPNFMKILKLNTDHCKTKKMTASLTVTTPLCTALLLIYGGDQLGMYIPENQIWIEKSSSIQDFMEAAASRSTLELSILSSDAPTSKDFAVPWLTT